MSDQNESEANVPAADVPAQGNSADFFSESTVASESAQPTENFKSKSKKFTWPIAAVVATALVAGLGGYAIGQNGRFDGHPVGSVERYGMHQPGGGPQDGMKGYGMKGNDMPGFGPQGRMGADGKCADGSVPLAPNQMGPGMMDPNQRGIDPDGDNWTGTNRQPAPTTSPSSITN